MTAQLEVLVYDHSAVTQPAPVANFTSASYKKVRSAGGTGSFTAPLKTDPQDGSRPYVSDAMARVLSAHGNTVPVRMRMVDFDTIDESGEPHVLDTFDGWVLDYKVEGAAGEKTVTVNVISVFAILHSIVAWPAPLLALAVQPGYYIYIGPAVGGFLNCIQINANRLGMPLVTVAPEGPDNSYLTNFAARMTLVDELMKDTLPDLTEWLDVRLWVPGDPQPRGYTLTAATYVVEFVSPPTRTGVIFEEADGGVESTLSGTAPEYGVAISGGKSPDWLNQVLSDAAESFFGGWGSAFKNIFFAFQSTQNPDRGGWGPLAPREGYVSGGAAAYTADSFQAGRQALTDAGGRRKTAFTFINGRPFTYGVDFTLGDIIGGFTELDAAVRWDYVGSIEVKDDRSNGLVVSATVGEDKPIQDPIAKLVGRVKNLLAMIQTVTAGQ